MISETVAPRVESAESTAPTQSGIARYVPLLVWLIALLSLVLIPAKIVGYGYLPADDALRHAAKAVSGKPWQQILVMSNEFPIDPHPGWHAVLGVFHKALNLNTDGLVTLAVAGLMFLVMAAPLPWLRRPEGWLAALLVAAVFDPRLINRLTLGRPYIFTMTCFLTILLMWRRRENERPTPVEVGVTVALIALASWIHGSWYQLGLPLAGFVLCGWWRSAVYYGVCWVIGTIVGCAFTGHPFQFLYQCAHVLLGAFGEFHASRELVTEFLPSGGDPTMLLAITAVLLWRSRSQDWSPRQILNPIFMMGVFGWLLGLKVYRFWDDWGAPAMLLWIGIQVNEGLSAKLEPSSFRRLMLTAGIAAALFLSTTVDLSSRYTGNLTNEYLREDDPTLAGWLPEKGGIMYSADMRVFYDTFFKNPHADWRYVLGFEPGLMLPEDREVLRKVQWNYGDVRAYEPWIQKMRPADRLVLRASSARLNGAPNLPMLEWKYAVSDVWIGRLPGHNGQ
jgi:hypothetical protein